MYNSKTIAEYTIKHCSENGTGISNLKLQKLLYFIQAEFLVGTGEACFSEDIKAMDFGPIVPTVYNGYKVYGCAYIPYIERGRWLYISRIDIDRLDEIIDACAVYSSTQLLEIIQNQAPWKTAYANGNGSIITNESLRNFFAEDELTSA